jgi:hypothetical protein
MSQHIRILRDRRRIECRKGRHLQILRGSHRFASASD